MAELIAVGKDAGRQSRHPLREGETLLLGRAPRNGWGVPWDRLISREHATATLRGEKLYIKQLETARNPLVLDGHPATEFALAPEGRFRIGDTTFSFHADAGEPESGSVSEHLFDADIASAPIANPLACLQALCKMPALIANTVSNEQLAERAVDLLMESIRGASAAAVMQYDQDRTRPQSGAAGADPPAPDRQGAHQQQPDQQHPDQQGPNQHRADHRAPGTRGTPTPAEPKLIRWASRGAEVVRFRPSRRLVARAFEQQRSIAHVWMDDSGAPGREASFTISGDLDWAFCTPIAVDASQRWCLYVSGKRRSSGIRQVSTPDDLLGELRLAELIAQFIGAVRRVRTLEQHQTEMRQFFSPAVVETLTGSTDFDTLAPRLGPVSVLFCDVRGFSRKAEQATGDLQALLSQVGQSLSVMTRGVLKYEGVVADFQGDATLGFWGWPAPAPDAALLACRAALGIVEAFRVAQDDQEGPLAGFEVGLGVTYGEAVTGRIGANEQIKVGVFGPVVNLASRLQDMTKQLGVSILVDEGVVREVAGALPAAEGSFRRVARLRPTGMDNPVEVYALTPAREAARGLGPAALERYQNAVDAVTAGEWLHACQLLSTLADTDAPSRFLLKLLRSAGQSPPRGWDGALSMAGKGELRLRE